MTAQGGRGGAVAYAKKHLLAGQTLDMLADMRSQFASMLADARFVAPPAGGRGRGPKPKGSSWADDPAAVWNRHASQPAVVPPLRMLQAHDVPDSRGCACQGLGSFQDCMSICSPMLFL